MVGLVIFTHGPVGRALRDCGTEFFPNQSAFEAIALDREADRSGSWSALQQAIDSVDQQNGVMVLVDMFGGTPSNLAMALLTRDDIAVVTGVNLPMMLRALQKREQLAVHELAEEVLAYGRRNVTSAAEWLKPEYTEQNPIGADP